MNNSDLAQSADILLIDDTPANLDILCELLEAEGHIISMAPNGSIGLQVATRSRPDLILLDILMPGMDGFEVCRQLKQDPELAHISVIFITGQDSAESAVTGFQTGGVDYITKPFRAEEVLARVNTHLHMNRLNRKLEQKNAELRQKNLELEESIGQRKTLKGQLSLISEREAERWGLQDFIGQSATIKSILKNIRLMQENIAPSVLITGESGTGKELIARAIHFGSKRGQGPFIPVNCAAVPDELVESLLFGHVKGTFTGAEADREGYFQMAHEGTLFLDEIGEMPLDLQAKLLRVLEDGEVWRIGEKEGCKVDVRVLAATNQDLQRNIRDGSFRQDLYFRIARFTVMAPPLRERREDIPLLAQHFLGLFAAEMGCDMPGLSADVIEMLKAYDFPGNVRELKNIIERAIIESGGQLIRPFQLYFLSSVEAYDDAPLEEDGVEDLPLNLEEAERRLIKRAMAQTRGNVSQAARLLGASRGRIYRVLSQENYSDT